MGSNGEGHTHIMGSNGEGQAWMKLMELATLYCVPMAMKAAIKLKVMDILAEHGGQDDQFLSASQIVSHLECPLAPSTSLHQAASTLDRILRVLASHGVLASSLHKTRQGELIRTYGLNSLSHLLVQKRLPHSFAPGVLCVQDPILIKCFDNLHDAVLDGGVPFTKAHGMSLFSYTQVDASFNKLLNNAMASHSKMLMQSVLEIYNGFEEISSLVDVGGGIGACLAMITSKHPHIQGINFDQAQVVAVAPEYPGIKHVEGDMFVKIPKADAIFMKWILHDWSDTDCLKILENCYKALPKEGKVIVVDAILPVQVECGLGARLNYHEDLHMLAHTEGGKERTRIELENISKAAGFPKLQVICNIDGYGVIEIYKGN